MHAFKFIHAADLHLDGPLSSLKLYAPDQVKDYIRLASRQALKNLVQLALAERVDFVVLSGDIYDGQARDYRTGLYFLDQMASLTRNGLKVYAIAGNHDASSRMARQLPRPPGMHVFPAAGPASLALEEHSVALHGQSYPERSVSRNLAVDYPAPRPGCFNIGLLHTSLTGLPGHEPYAPCSLDDLRRHGYDYWALGHSHFPDILNEQPHIVYAGTTQGRHILETGPHGCYLVEVDENASVRAQFRPLDVIRWEHALVRPGPDDPAELVPELAAAEIGRLKDKHPDLPLAVRLEIAGPCRAHNELLSDPEGWRAQMALIARQVSGHEVWLEKIIFNTLRLAGPGQIERTGPLAELDQALANLRLVEAERDAFMAEIKSLWAGLPKELYPAGAPYKTSDDWFLRLLEEAGMLLENRLGLNPSAYQPRQDNENS